MCDHRPLLRAILKTLTPWGLALGSFLPLKISPDWDLGAGKGVLRVDKSLGSALVARQVKEPALSLLDLGTSVCGGFGKKKKSLETPFP